MFGDVEQEDSEDVDGFVREETVLEGRCAGWIVVSLSAQ